MTKIFRSDEMRKQNRAKVLAALRVGGSMSRTKIAKQTALSAATVTTITADLFENNVLLRSQITGEVTSTRGRPRVALSFNPDFACVGIIVLQLNLIIVSLVDYQGNAIFETRMALETTSMSSEQLLQQLAETFRIGLNTVPQAAKTLRHIAVGVQGTTDSKASMLLWSPIIKHQELPIQDHLQCAFKVPVSVHNDCNMIAHALKRLEPDLYNSDFAAILFSQGIGMGLYRDGKLVKGQNSSATEFGHMTYIPGGALCRCGAKGCIEAYAGEYAIYRNAGNLGETSPPRDDIRSREMEMICDQAHNNVADAVSSYQKAGSAVGTGLSSLFALFDPFPVAFVGSGCKARDVMEKSIKKAIEDTSIVRKPDQISLRFYEDKNPLIRDGCAVTALMEVDKMIKSKTNKKNKKDKKMSEMALPNAG